MAVMMTHSGRLVGRDTGTPTLVDIGLALSRVPRFGGHALRWWSVLDHSIYCAWLAEQEGASPELRLALLLHDGHEALTGDIPSPIKPEAITALQATFDERLMSAYYPGGSSVYEAYRSQVKAYDRRALIAEAVTVGPPKLGALTEAELVELFGELPATLEADKLRLRYLLNAGIVARPDYIARGKLSPQVREFVRLATSLTPSVHPVSLPSPTIH